MKEYGAYFKELRTAKGFTLRQTAEGIISYQFLSNFENGVSNISLYNFTRLLNRINVTVNEFFSETTDLTDYFLEEFGHKVTRLGYAKNIINQKQFLETLKRKQQETKEAKYLHLYIVAEVFFARTSGNYQETAQLEIQIQTLRQYLLETETWTNYELYLFSHASFIFNHEEIKAIYKTRYLRIKKIRKTQYEHNRYADEFLISIINHFTNTGYLNEAKEALTLYQEYAERDPQIQAYMSNSFYRYVEAKLTISLGNPDGLEKMARLLNSLYFIGDYTDIVNKFYIDTLEILEKTNKETKRIPQTIELIDGIFKVINQP